MNDCTNVCGITASALKELEGQPMEVRRPSGAVLQVAFLQGTYTLADSRDNLDVFPTLGALKKELRKR